MKFAVVDLSKTILQADLDAYAAAQQTQLRAHYASVYDGDGDQDEVRVAYTGDPLAAGEVPIALHATADGAPEGALAVHGMQPDGTPSCDVYLDLLAQDGQPWQTAASHEVLEARTDPRLHACVELDDGTIWDREACDRVEADAYPIDNVPMSNFNTPSCWEPAGFEGERYDWLGLSTKPNEVRPGGYAQQFTLEQGWTQVGEMRSYRRALAERGLSRGTKRKARASGSVVDRQFDKGGATP